jgi:hypothetical protein
VKDIVAEFIEEALDVQERQGNHPEKPLSPIELDAIEILSELSELIDRLKGYSHE